MCANYAPTRSDRLLAEFGVRVLRDDYVDDCYPGHVAPFLRSDGGALRADLGVFGMIPSWSRDGKNFRQCYNARAETVAEKPSFRHAWRQHQRCVVPADAFYEPSYESGKAVRWRIEAGDGRPLRIAGLWEHWRAPSGESVLSFTLLTINADAHAVMSRFHAPGDEKRSVVLLDAHGSDAWLDPRNDAAAGLLGLFEPSAVHTIASPRPPRSTRRQQT